VLRAETVDRATHDLSDDTRRLTEAVKLAGLWAHELRIEAQDAGGRVTGGDPRD
jgi:hypothetical protein